MDFETSLNLVLQDNKSYKLNFPSAEKIDVKRKYTCFQTELAIKLFIFTYR